MTGEALFWDLAAALQLQDARPFAAATKVAKKAKATTKKAPTTTQRATR